MERYVGYSGRGRPSPRLGVQRIPKKSLVGLYLSERAPRFGQDLCISYSLNLTLHRIMFAPETHSLRRTGMVDTGTWRVKAGLAQMLAGRA